MEFKAIVSDDITELILDDHATFRRLFARLDDADSPDVLRKIWFMLAPLLEAHAAAEEAVFYPALLKAAHDDDDVQDMVKDHNDIRDAVHAANLYEVATDEWRHHVKQARDANSDHMSEEERETLPAARRSIPTEERVRLGIAFLRLRNAFPSGELAELGDDKNPEDYVRENS